MLDDHGKTFWKLPTGVSSIFDSSNSLAVSDDHIAAGTTVTGYSGTLYYLDLSGHQIWSRHVDSAILDVQFIAYGRAMSVHTNWGTQTFDLNGNQMT